MILVCPFDMPEPVAQLRSIADAGRLADCATTFAEECDGHQAAFGVTRIGAVAVVVARLDPEFQEIRFAVTEHDDVRWAATSFPIVGLPTRTFVLPLDATGAVAAVLGHEAPNAFDERIAALVNAALAAAGAS
jgi:hypothetical protein